MEGAAGDTTQDWLLPEQARPPLVGELERRVNEALATARASEAAIVTVGAAALDAAEQARRAAELAERASVSALAARDEAAAASSLRAQGPDPAGDPEPDALGDFSDRADRLVARLKQLQRIPLAAPAANDVAAQTQSAS
jgi:hypothetical protein